MTETLLQLSWCRASPHSALRTIREVDTFEVDTFEVQDDDMNVTSEEIMEAVEGSNMTEEELLSAVDKAANAKTANLFFGSDNFFNNFLGRVGGFIRQLASRVKSFIRVLCDAFRGRNPTATTMAPAPTQATAGQTNTP